MNSSELGQVAQPPNQAEQSFAGSGKRQFQYFITHKWWIGISGLFTVAAVMVPLVVDKDTPRRSSEEKPKTVSSTASDQPDGPGNAVMGDCNAQGTGNSVTCIQASPTPTVNGLTYFRVSSRSEDEKVAHFALPLDVDLENFPHNDSGGPCDPAQAAWLRSRGVEVPAWHLIKIRNAAPAGAMLGVTDLRIVELKSQAPKPTLWFDCPSAGSDDVVKATLYLSQNGKVEIEPPNVEKPISGAAYSVSLQPGEGSIVLARVDGDRLDYSGKLMVTIRYGDSTKDVVLPLAGEGDTFSFPGRGDPNNLVVTPSSSSGGPFTCSWGYQGMGDACTAAEARNRARSAWKR